MMAERISAHDMTREERSVHDAVFDRVRSLTAAWLVAAVIAAAFWIDSLHLWDRGTGQLIGAGASIPMVLGVWWLADRVASREAQSAVRQIRRRQ